MLADSADEYEADRALESLLENNQMLALLGPPGTGKTTVTHRLVEWVLQRDGRVLFTTPT